MPPDTLVDGARTIRPGTVTGLPLGTLTIERRPPGCLAGFSCQAARVRCPGVAEDDTAIVATGLPDRPARGVAVFLSGGGGQSWWSDTGREALAASFLQELRDDGLAVVQVRWTQGWLRAQVGEEVGPARLACRPATVLAWLHDRGLAGSTRPGPGPCGFCVSGQSGGASQAAYALSHYGLEGLVDALVLTGGPPHAALAKGCADSRPYRFAPASAGTVDGSYGFATVGPCVRADAAFADRWTRDAVDTGGTSYRYPDTNVSVVIGDRDSDEVISHASDYVARLQQADSRVELTLVPGVGHSFPAHPAGIEALRKIFRGGAPPGPR